MAGDAMRVMGMMSGTSADGIDVALARISGAAPAIGAKFEGHYHVRFPGRVREAILRLANGGPTTTAEISQLNFVLGEEFERAAIAACKKWRMGLRQISLIGSHGQTVFHQGAAAPFLGRRVASTLQIGEPSVIAERTGVMTIGDFRPADMAARPGQLIAFDIGPGNMVIDAIVEASTRGRAHYDRDARLAIRGKLLPTLLSTLLKESYLRKRPPKTAGREQFGREYAQKILAWGKRHRAPTEDLIRTATVFTSLSIADALRKFVLPRMRVHELIVAGGGARNPLLMAQLAASLPEIEIVPASKFGIPAEAKEAFAFAVLAYEAYHGRANNLPSATGARHPAVMGKLVRGRER